MTVFILVTNSSSATTTKKWKTDFFREKMKKCLIQNAIGQSNIQLAFNCASIHISRPCVQILRKSVVFVLFLLSFLIARCFGYNKSKFRAEMKSELIGRCPPVPFIHTELCKNSHSEKSTNKKKQPTKNTTTTLPTDDAQM